MESGDLMCFPGFPIYPSNNSAAPALLIGHFYNLLEGCFSIFLEPDLQSPLSINFSAYHLHLSISFFKSKFYFL